MRILIFLGIIQTILWLGHLLIYKTYIKFIGFGVDTHLGLIRLLFFLLSIFFLSASLVSNSFYGPLARFFYSTAAVWLGTLYWLFLASVLIWILYSFSRLFSFQLPLSFLSFGLFFLALIISAYGVWNSFQIKVKEVPVTLKNLPQQWKGKKAVLVADTHFGSVRNASFGRKVAAVIAKQKPDIVFHAGDFFDGPIIDYVAAAKSLENIPSTYGTYFATGNHEEFRDKTPLVNAIKTANIRVLDNEIITLDGLQIIGLDYKDTINSEDQRRILEGLKLDRSLPSIVIKHVPSNIEVAQEAGISLQVSGHSHRGQVQPMEYITKKLFKGFHYGLNSLGDTQVFTTSGVGTWGPPQRVGTNSEIIVLIFQ